MAVAPTVERELLSSGLDFQLVHHRPTEFSLESARMARVPPERVAKGVVLRDAVGYVLAVIPANAVLDLARIRLQLGRELNLAQEGEAALLFHDCVFGAFPALGTAYGVETWIDERLAESPDIYFEAGDHELLVRLETPDFLHLLHQVNYGHFAQPGFNGSPRRRWARSSPASMWSSRR
jgi:Ala-tRNA(Pro) deacylase